MRFPTTFPFSPVLFLASLGTCLCTEGVRGQSSSAAIPIQPQLGISTTNSPSNFADFGSTNVPAATIDAPNQFNSNLGVLGNSGGNSTPSLGAPVGVGIPVGNSAQNTATPFVWGPFVFHPHLDYGFTYGTGLNFSPGNQQTTAQHSLSPGISVTSKHLLLDYTPSLVFYSKGNFQDAVNHSAKLQSDFGYGDWHFGISQGYQKTFSSLVETATQTHTEDFGTGLTASYLYSRKIFFDFSLSQQIQSAEGFQGSRQWSTMDWVNYRIRDPLSLGIGAGAGYVDVDVGSNMSYEMIQGRVAWNPSAKTAINVNGGIEVRQFLGFAGVEDRVNPIMGASISYAPFDYTTLSLVANRVINTSIFENQITEDTSVTAALNQRFLGHFNFGLSGGYRTSDYQGTSAFLDVTRSDEYSFITTSLGTSFLKRGSISISYLHGMNKSSLAGYTYDSDQYSLNVGYRF